MAAVTYDGAMARVYADEGGYCDDAHDPGGATKYGITIIDARLYAREFGWITDRAVTKDDVRAMPKSFAAKVYAEKYAKPMHYDELPAGLDYSVLDAAINSGVGRAPKWLASALQLAAAPIAALVKPANDNGDKVALIKRYWNVRLGFLQSLGTWRYFGKGWGRRVAEGEVAAVKMWLTFGAQGLSEADVKKRMNAEAPGAKTDAKKSATKAATAGGGGAAVGADGTGQIGSSPMINWDAIGSVAGKVLLAMVIAAAVVGVIYFVRNTMIHNQRAAAYAAA